MQSEAPVHHITAVVRATAEPLAPHAAPPAVQPHTRVPPRRLTARALARRRRQRRRERLQQPATPPASHAFLTNPGAVPSDALAEHGPPQGEQRRGAEASAESHPRPPGPQSATSSCARAPRMHLHPS